MVTSCYIPKILCLVIAFLVIILVAERANAQTQTQTIVFVDGYQGDNVSPSASEPGDSWSNAYLHLQDGLTRADQLFFQQPPPTDVQIWVRGRPAPDDPIKYFPDRRASAAFGGTDLPGETFTLRNNVQIYAGFAGPSYPGGGETLLSQRIPALNITVLSGDIGDEPTDLDAFEPGIPPNTPPVFTNYGDNAAHVVTAPTGIVASSAGPNLDGFVVTSGRAASSNGGGIFMNNASPLVRGCTIQRCYAFNSGGGIYSFDGSPVIRNCRIIDNVGVRQGGGMFLTDGSKVLNCLVLRNWSKQGGGLYADGPVSMKLISSTFDLNQAFDVEEGAGSHTQGGGAILGDTVSDSSSADVINCRFTRNGGADVGGGLVSGDVQLAMTNCTVAENIAEDYAGGMDLQNTFGTGITATISSSIVWGNLPTSQPQIETNFGIGVTVQYTDVQGTPVYPGIDNINDDPDFVNPSIGNYRVNCGSPCIDEGDPNAGQAPPTGFPTDQFDVDEDGDTTVKIPTVELLPRIIPANEIDMGAYEASPESYCVADIAPVGNPDGEVNVLDLLLVIGQWSPGTTCPCAADVAPIAFCSPADGVVDVLDLLAIIGNWGHCAGASLMGPPPPPFPTEVGECSAYCEDFPGSYQQCMQKCFEAICANDPPQCE